MSEIDRLLEVLRDCYFYSDFLFNFHMCKDIDIKRFCYKYKPNVWIKEAFRWLATNQGFDYWKDINEKWEKFVETGNLYHISEWYHTDEEKEKECPKESKTNDEKVNPKFSIEARKKRQGKLNFAL